MLPFSTLTNSLADGQLAVLALALVVAAVTGAAAWQARAARRVWLLLAALVAVATAVRLAAAWGPGDLAEARRWDVLYAVQPDDRPLFYGVPTLVELLARAGVPSLTLYRGFGLLSGALAVIATALLALALELPLLWAGVAGLLVALWPAHVHYSVSGGFSVLAGAAVAATLAAARADLLRGAWRPVAVATLAALAIYVRPEARVVLPAAALLALRPSWTGWQRLQLAAATALFVAGYAPQLLSRADRVVESSPADLAFWLLAEPRVAPVWWCGAGLVGLAVGRTDRMSRAALAVALLGLLAGYLLTTEPNPGFGLWRYFTALLPLLAVGAALLLARWPRLEARPAVVVGAVLATLVPYAPLWLQPSDMHSEFTALRAGAPVALDRADLLLLPDQGGDPHTGRDHFATALLALHLATGLTFRAAETPDVRGTLGTLPVASLEAWLANPQRARPKRVVAWFGLPVSPERERQLRAVGHWRPLATSASEVLLQLPESDARCPPAEGQGVTLRPCSLQLAWQVLEP
ncbi:MAG: hypothetical protein HY902_12220 [Deltaproteobacteria bacterium]|nr:hypothetical protein [Deltaproteobacteria bacterium]